MDSEETEKGANTSTTKTYHRTIGPSETIDDDPQSEFSLVNGTLTKSRKRALNDMAHLDQYKFENTLKNGEKKIPVFLKS